MSKLAELHDAALPFVTRSLRGGRLRRYALLSALLGGLTVVLGGWLTFGSGTFEREVRVALDLEESRWNREQNQFVIEAGSPEEAALIRNDMGQSPWSTYRQGYYGPGRALTDDAVDTLIRAAQTDAPPGHRDLQDAARALLRERGFAEPAAYPDASWQWFNWYEPDHVRRVRAIVDARLVPRVEVYHSPLGPTDAVRMTGGIAGALMAALMLILAPLLAGAQMAQEVHENTLMPLTGTALRARQLVLGLTAGPLAIIALLLAPQALLLLAAAAAAGYVVPALAAIAVAGVGAFMLSMLTQLLGYALGQQRAPGVVGVGLLGFLGFLAMAGTGFGLFPSRGTVGVLALLPEAATAHLLRTAFIPHEIFSDGALACRADLATGVGTVGIAILGLLGMRALERRISRTGGPALSRGEALLGAAVSTALVLLANPVSGHSYSNSTFYLSNLALLSLPFAILLMMRVPVGETPNARRAIPVGGLLAELAGFAAVHGVATLALVRDPGHALSASPIAYLYLGWYFLMLGLVSIRAVALPMGLGARLWVTFAGFFALLAFPHMAEWTRPYASPDADDIFGLYQLSPFLGLVQALLMIAVPWLLLRPLRRA